MSWLKRYRLQMGFKDDFGLIEVKLLEKVQYSSSEPPKETLEWENNTENHKDMTVRYFRVRSGVVLALIGLVLTSAGFISGVL